MRPVSVSMPFGSVSSTAMRIDTTKSGPTRWRIARSTRIGKRMRFSNDPPYRSVRWFVAGDQNWSSRWPYASISTPSMPPACMRSAASA